MASLMGWSALAPSTTFGPGDRVRLSRGETLQLEGKNFAGAAKGQDFTLLQLDNARKIAALEYYKKDGTRVAVTLPSDALEASPAEGWSDLLQGVEAFRDGRLEVSRAYLLRAAQDEKSKAMAAAIAQRFNLAAGARANPAAGPQAMLALRDLAAALCKNGSYSLGCAVDFGADRLGTSIAGATPSKLTPEDRKRGETVTRAAALCRQSYAVHKTKEASGFAQEAVEADPTRADLLELQKKIKKDLAEAEDRLADADRMRKIPKGEVHAITALQLGLKLAVDHPGLIALKREMQGAVEERTAPPVTPAFLAATKTKTPVATLEEGRKLYTVRCTECHDLETLDSRSAANWEKMVGSMSRRAGLKGDEQARIVEYLSVAVNAVE